MLSQKSTCPPFVFNVQFCSVLQTGEIGLVLGMYDGHTHIPRREKERKKEKRRRRRRRKREREEEEGGRRKHTLPTNYN